MTTSPRSMLTLSAACTLALAWAAPVRAATAAAWTVYRSDSGALYASSGDGSVDAGYAVVREQRVLKLAAGTQDVILGDLPIHIDPEAIALGFPDGGARILSQRLLLAEGTSGALNGRRQRHPTPVLLPGKSHGWRSLVGCSPWGH